MSIKFYDKSGESPQEKLLAGVPVTDQILNATSKNPIANKAVYNALRDKIDKTVNDLLYYYSKSDVYNKAEVRELIGAIDTLTMEVVSALPVSDISTTTIYLLKQSGSNVYDEYVYISDAWVKIGTTEMDLSGYLTVANFNIAIADYYTKAEIDAFIDNFYTKAEIDADFYDKVDMDELLDGKQDVLTFDSVPTQGSANPVQSGGTFNAIKAVSDNVEALSDEIANEIATRAKVSGHNIGKITKPSLTGLTGLDFTVNSDGSVKVNGTSTAAWSFIMNNAMLLKAGSYIISSGIGANPNLYVQITNESQSTDIANTANSAEKTFTLNVDTIVVYRIFYLSGQTFNNVVVKPMIRLATDESADHEPYSMTNQEMTPYVQAISNPNLFDNPWFTVNQRGFTTRTFSAQQYEYSVDRWRMASNSGAGNSTVTLNNGAITVSNDDNQGETYFEQLFENGTFENGRNYTLSVMLSDGTIVKGTNVMPTGNTGDTVKIFITFTNGNFYVYHPTNSSRYYVTMNIYNGSITIKAVKLEFGSVSTLAMDTAPNYATELAKCQRYFQRIGKNSSSQNGKTLGVSSAFATSDMWVPIYLPVPLRATPTININGKFAVTKATSTQPLVNTDNGLAIYFVNFNETDISLINLQLVNQNSNYTVGDFYRLVTIAGDSNVATIDLSADL